MTAILEIVKYIKDPYQRGYRDGMHDAIETFRKEAPLLMRHAVSSDSMPSVLASISASVALPASCLSPVDAPIDSAVDMTVVLIDNYCLFPGVTSFADLLSASDPDMSSIDIFK